MSGGGQAADLRTLTVQDAADVLGVSSETVRRWIRSGRLVAMRWGRRFRIRPDAIEQFQESSRVEVRNPAVEVRAKLAHMRTRTRRSGSGKNG